MRSYLRLIRPGLLAVVLFSMTVAALTAGEELPPWPQLLHALVGTGLLIAGAVSMNQRLEQRTDAVMARTAGRPLPSRDLTPGQVARFAVLVSLAGAVYRLTLSTRTVAAMAVFSWVVYVAIYTPLKRVSVWQTPVGAVAGAIPMLLGAATADALWSPMALVLFGIVFTWQFPHTMAIAWIYKPQYAASTLKVATTVDEAGHLAGGLALVGAASLLPVCLVPTALSIVGWPFGVAAALLGLIDVIAAARFQRTPNDATARTLWRVSMVHLPLLLVALLLALRC
jgi:protoheme IX farnesyltransferase